MGRKRQSVTEQLALDEAVAKALQHTENKLAFSAAVEEFLTEDDGGSSNTPNDYSASASTSDVVTTAHQDDIDPDGMSYENLQSLTEAVGSESRGLSDDLISFLPSSTYKRGFVLKDKHHECVICCMSYEKEEMIITLPCEHHYHSDCIKKWLKINKACPVCKNEVFG